MSNFREKPIPLGLTTPIGAEPVGGLRPAGDWRLDFEGGAGRIKEGRPNDDLTLGLAFVPGRMVHRPDRDWRFDFGREVVVEPEYILRVTQESGQRLTMDGVRRSLDGI